MTFQDPIELIGGTASPYTQKAIALLRYRRLPFRVFWGDPNEVCKNMGIVAPKPALAPTFICSSSEGLFGLCDTTPIVRMLEAATSERSVVPTDPALAFVDYLIEDFADEWCTKYMFHYRWHYEADADKAGTILPLSVNTALPEDDLKSLKRYFSKRQIDRLFVVGSNEITAPVIDASYRRFLTAMEAHLARQHFMLGERPGVGDFGLHGQLSQLIGFDPTPRAIAHEFAPRTVSWVDRNYDLSGLSPSDSDWLPLEDQADSLLEVMHEIGRVYAPAQLANAKALEAGEREWRCLIDGASWEQRTFSYQAKCLQWTKNLYADLDKSARARVDRFLSGTGIEPMLRPI